MRQPGEWKEHDSQEVQYGGEKPDDFRPAIFGRRLRNGDRAECCDETRDQNHQCISKQRAELKLLETNEGKHTNGDVGKKPVKRGDENQVIGVMRDWLEPFIAIVAAEIFGKPSTREIAQRIRQ